MMPAAMENNPELSELIDCKRETAKLTNIISRIALTVETELAMGHGCPFCRHLGMYQDGEYWHGSGCVYDEAIASYRSGAICICQECGQDVLLTGHADRCPGRYPIGLQDAFDATQEMLSDIDAEIQEEWAGGRLDTIKSMVRHLANLRSLVDHREAQLSNLLRVADNLCNLVGVEVREHERRGEECNILKRGLSGMRVVMDDLVAKE
jgi:hypothetical protein